MTPDEPKNPLKDNAPPGEPAAAARRLVSRRALVRAGWVVPVALALHVPLNAFATYACAHSDAPATAHTDIPGTAHSDVPGQSHSDAHTDTFFINQHFDIPFIAHSDVPVTAHGDVAGTAHVDACV